jgi:formate/nitrite transporter
MLSVCTIGGGKPRMSVANNLIMAFLAGAYIGFGSLFAIKVAANIPVAQWGNLTRLVFGGVFPCGLLLVLVAGADLFTGNCMYLPSAVIHKKATWGGLARSWLLSYVGNLIGSMFVAFFLGFMTGLLFDLAADGSRPLAAYAVNLANMKCNLSWDVAFLRGIGCNWLVCLAIYMSLTATDAVSKTAVIWPPITAFVALGFEHSVANMTFIPLGIFLGQSDIYLNNAVALPALTATWHGFFITNLVPVTLGNIAGGAIFVAMLYYKGIGLKAE